MSRIEFEQISEDEVEVVLPPETPMAMVEQIKKSFIERGLIEDLAKSTVNVRYFFRPQDEVNQLADKLIKSLQGLAKDDFIQSPKNIKQWKRTMAAKDAVNTMRTKPVNTAAPSPTGARMYDSHSGTAGGTGKRYAYISDDVKKQEHDKNNPECACEKCSIEKSGYGPKGAKLYNQADNARRKMRNLSDQQPVGPNENVKAYSTRPGQLSNRQQADELSRRQAAMNRKQPIKRTKKDFSPEELAAMTARNLKKGWADHLPFPNAEEEMAKQEEINPVERAENLMSNQLANLMNNKAMLNPLQRQPSSEDMIMAGERMGLGAASEEVIKAQEQQWGSSINDFYREASKPLSARFASEEEEIAYWNSIKVGDRDDGKPGY